MFDLVKVICSLITGYLVYRTITDDCNKYLAFAIVAVWLRLVLSAFHEYTIPQVIGGFSINAVCSIMITGVGLLKLPPKVLKLKKIAVFYLLFTAIAVSGLLNGEFVGTINVLVKWCYFLVICGSLILSIRYQGLDYSMKKLLVAFHLPLWLQVFAVLMGYSKATESDGSVSYVGGYNHESTYSMILVAYMYVVGVIRPGALKFRSVLFFTGLVLLLLANYRTALLAVLPTIIIFVYNMIEHRIEKRHKAPVMMLVAGGLAIGLVAVSYLMRERFSDIVVLLSDLDNLIKAPIYYTEMEKDILSQRVYIWSIYLYNYYVQGDWLNWLFGYGPESWHSIYHKYAHNTFVSYIYETGIFGLSAFLLVNVVMTIQAFLIRNTHVSRTTFYTQLGFMLMNMSTMPLWNVEGLIFYGILIATIVGPREPRLERHYLAQRYRDRELPQTTPLNKVSLNRNQM